MSVAVECRQSLSQYIGYVLTKWNRMLRVFVYATFSKHFEMGYLLWLVVIEVAVA